MPRPLLVHQFPISHYCEKIRWVLDYKQLPYRVKNQLPGVHLLVNQRLVGRGSVPVLVDGHHAIGNSSDIALYLDDQYPARQLIPREPSQREQVLALEAYFDEHAGPAVRRYVYGFVLQDVALFRRVFLRGYTGLPRLIGAAIAPPIIKQIGAMYRIGREGSREAQEVIGRVLARLEELIDGDPARYLVGDTLTLADVTAASLLAPLVAPNESPWNYDLKVSALADRRDALCARPAGRWILERYARDRTPRARSQY
jgi:glutathione S-transferase